MSRSKPLGAADLRRLFTHLPVAVVYFVDERLVWTNAAGLALFGRTQDDLAGRTFDEFLAPEDKSTTQRRYWARQQGKQAPSSYEVTLVRADGSRVRVEIEPRTVAERQVLVMARDVSTRVRDAELLAALSHLAAKVQQARTEADVLSTTASGLLTLRMNSIVLKLEGDRVGVAQVGLKEDGASVVERLLGGGPVDLESLAASQRVIFQNRPEYQDDLAGYLEAAFANRTDDERALFAAEAIRLDCRKAVLAPLRVQDRAWGLLWVASGTLTSRDAAAVGLFAAQVASALESATVIADLERKNRHLAALHTVAAAGSGAVLDGALPDIARTAAQDTDSDAAAIFLVDPERAELVLAASYGRGINLREKYRRIPLAKTATGETALSLRPRALNVARDWPQTSRADMLARGLVETAIVPLAVNGRLAGTMNLSRNRPEPYSAAELATAEMLAGQIAVQVENARLYRDERQRAEQFKLLHDVARAITASLDLEQTLVAAATSTARMVKATAVFIWLRDPATGLLRGAATSAPEFREHFLQARMSVDDTALASLCIRQGKPVWTPDTAHSPDVHHPLTERYGTRSLMAIPLLLRDQVIGSVAIGDAQAGRAWTSAEIELASLICRQVAVAVSNARLFDDLKKSYDELAHTQQALVKRERLAALGELSAVVAHEVRNPLGVIFNSLGALRRPGASASESAMLLQMVGEEADRLNRIVGGLLDFAKPQEPALEHEPVEALLTGAIEAARANAGEHEHVRVECRLDGAPGRVWVDSRMMRQALVNLVVNAMQASPPRGQVRVRALADARDGKAVLRLEVSDAGPGVPPELAERIFQPFFTTRATGTGLGLAVVKRIVEAHHGDIEVGPNAEGGATFTLRLPADEPPAFTHEGT